MMDGPKIPKNSILLALGSFLLVLLVYPLDILPLKFEEPRRALVAVEMMIQDNYWAPTINGEFYYNKPPFFNWILVAFFNLFGFHNWVERLPSILSIIGIAVANYQFFKQKIGKAVAALASLAFLLSGHMLFYFSFQGEIDITYSFIVILQVITIIHFHEKRKWLELFLLSYLLMTVGFLMKGLPSIAFQGLTLLGIFTMKKDFKLLFHPYHFLAFGFSIALLSGYFFAYSKFNNPELFLAKLTVESASRTGAGGGISSYFIQILKLPVLILSIMLPGSLILLFSSRRKIKDLLANKWIKYILLFLLFNIPLYWISPGTRDRYLYMFLPFIYNLIFFLGMEGALHRANRLKWILTTLSGVIGLAFIVLPFVVDGIDLVVSLISFLFLSVTIFLTFKNQSHPILGFMLLMMVLRFFYNHAVFPVREESSDNIAATKHASIILEQTAGESVYFYGTHQSTQLKLPFRNPIEIKEIERLPYQLSYYYSSSSGQIIRWTGEEPMSGYYIVSEGTTRIGEQDKDPKRIYSFEMEGRKFSLLKK